MGYRVELTQAATAKPDGYIPGSAGHAFNSNLLGKGGILNRCFGGPAEVSYPSSPAAHVDNGGMTKNCTKVLKGAIGGNGTAGVAAQPVPVVNAAMLGFRALGVGTLFSVGGVGILTAGVFYISGCSTLQELLTTWKTWTPARRRQLEHTLGINPKSMQHEDVKATAGMTEDEEWDFIKEKYIPELAEGKREGET